jgi:3-oxoacyl-[acyl-carrier protein] reductase
MNATAVDRTTSAIVTGSAQGIGAVEAEHLVASGRFVVLNDIDADLLEETAQWLGGPGVAVAVAGDISQSETARRLVAAATEDGRRLDVVINNAGAIANGMIHTVTDEEFDHVVAVNLRGPYMLSREAATYWRNLAETTGQAHRATLISTTSRAALLANPGQTNYGAPKAGVAVMTQILARELRTVGVRCNVIAPRAYTKMMRDGLGEFREDSLEEWSPKHIGRFVDFLCGPGGDGITGQIFVVHGPRVNLVRTWAVSEPVEIDYSGGIDGVLGELATVFDGEPMEISEFQTDDFPLADPEFKNPFKVESTAPAVTTMS